MCTGSLRKHGIVPFFYVFNVVRSDRNSKERKKNIFEASENAEIKIS